MGFGFVVAEIGGAAGDAAAGPAASPGESIIVPVPSYADALADRRIIDNMGQGKNPICVNALRVFPGCGTPAVLLPPGSV